ncbi:MAG: hypothetical protein IJ486_06700 [Firmicutes bacterium]|nr:hypothetical protein [Bacillota bacterium]
MKKRVLFYGDSNTWGYIPGTGNRFPEDIRWPSVVGTILSDHIVAVESAISGRTTVYDDPLFASRNGRDGLGYALASHAPLDLVVLCLGVNDLKYVDAIASAKGFEELIRILENADARYPLPLGSSNFPNGLKLLILSPISLHPEIQQRRPDSSLRLGYEESLKYPELYQRIAKDHNAWFMNAADYAEPSLKDCVHMDAESHLALAEAVADKIREIFEL